MISLDDVRAVRREMFDRSMGLVEKKGHDYNRAQQQGGDTLFNLRVAAVLGVVDRPERGVMVRLSDKLMRLISLLDADPAVSGESFEDTVLDVHNYVDYLVAFKRERAPRPAPASGAAHEDVPV